tara:strand:- start:210 stop:1139 length:930 start_codon:yes stop_codon:yes gene_type:complete
MKQIKNFKIGVVGNGYVGKATQLFECDSVQCIVYDKDPEKCSPQGTTLQDLKTCDLVFVCVPTPMKPNGNCDLSIVKSVIKDLGSVRIRKNKIVVRSTVPVGTCKKLKVNFMPEFLTEKNWREDFYKNTLWLCGTDNMSEMTKSGLRVQMEDITKTGEVLEFNTFVNKMRSLLALAKKHDKIECDNVTFTSTKHAEFVKYVRNSFLAVKVSFFNEIEEFCLKNDLKYDLIRKLSCCDPRIGESHTQVPGPDNKRGYGGTCFPKDVSSLLHQMKTSKVKTMVLKSAQVRNEKIDRPEKDWEQEKGRAVSE